MNLNYSAKILPDGSFRVAGIPEGPMKVSFHNRKLARLAKPVAFEVLETSADEIPLGVVQLLAPEVDSAVIKPEPATPRTAKDKTPNNSKPDNSKVEAASTEESPRIRVQVIDEDRTPLNGAAVLVYDRNHYMAGKKVDFEPISGRAGAVGWVDLGPLPQDFVCVQVGGNQKLSGMHAVIFAGNHGFQQANPDRANVSIDSDR